MKKLIIAGFGQPLIDLYHCLKENFEVIGVIPDYERKAKFPFFYEFLEAENLQIYLFEAVKMVKPDAVVVINYNKIIDISMQNTAILLNIHMGLLPVYRGNNANSWALLNGDRKVGYTLHEVSEVLDGGKIFYKYEYEIPETETYFEAKRAINADIVAVLPTVIEKVIDGLLPGVSQENEKFLYAAKLVPEDGVISNWNCTTNEIINRNMIFARPLGTGLKMLYNGGIIEISKLSTVANYLKSNGIPGAVVMKNTDGSVWVKTKDTVISIDELIVNGTTVKPSTLFKIGERL